MFKSQLLLSSVALTNA